MNKTHLERSMVLLVVGSALAYPTYHYLPVNGLPLDSFIELFIFCFFLFIVFTYYSDSKSLILLSLVFFLISKILLLTTPPSYWKACFRDDLAPVTEKFQYEQIDYFCEKKYSVTRTKLSGYYRYINFFSPDSSQSWRGANASTFPLSFFNSKKFNLDRTNEPRREWLPFNAILYSDLDRDIKFIKLEYIGELSVKFDTGDTGFGIPNEYLEKKYFVLNRPDYSSSITVNYRFYKFPLVLSHPTRQKDYPQEPYAHLMIYGSPDGDEWSLLENKKTNQYKVGYYLFLASSLILVFIPIFKNIMNIDKSHILNVFFLFVLFISLLNIEYLRMLPVVGFLDTLTVLLLILSVFYLYLFRKNMRNYCLLIFCYLMNLLLVDYPWDKLDFYLRPGGSDSLTYESQARLIMLGDGLRGGSDVFFYSPGYRYVLNLLHYIFGDGWFIAWYSILSICLFYFLRYSLNLLSSGKFIIFVFPILGFTYLTSNAIQRIFRFGMSEAISTLVLCYIFYYLFSELENTKLIQLINGLLIGIGIVVRPDWIIGFLVILMFPKLRSKLCYLGAGFISLLPLLHNLYFGGKFIIFSTAANYGRNLLVETSSISSFIESFQEVLVRNIPYLIMSPFNQDVIGRVGLILPVLFLFVWISCLLLVPLRLNKKDNASLLLLATSVVGFISPFLIYDPVLFYPRHLLGAYVSTLFLLIYLVSPSSSPGINGFSYRVVIKESI